MNVWRRRVTGVALGAVLLSVPLTVRAAKGGGGEDHAGLFRTLVVEPETPAGDVACAFCTVVVRGKVNGDLAVLFSTVHVEDGQEIAGDVAGLFSTLEMGDGAAIGGDLAWALGRSSIRDGAQVRGDRAILGSGFSAAVVLAPLLIVIGVVWLLVWGIRRVVWP